MPWAVELDADADLDLQNLNLGVTLKSVLALVLLLIRMLLRSPMAITCAVRRPPWHPVGMGLPTRYK